MFSTSGRTIKLMWQASASRSNISLKTGAEYCVVVKRELACSSSAAANSRFSSSELLPGMKAVLIRLTDLLSGVQTAQR